MTQPVAFAAAGAGFTLSAPEPLASVLIESLADLRVPTASRRGTALTVAANGDGTFSLRRGTLPTGPALDAAQALHGALSMVNETVAEAWSIEHAAIHAAVVDRRGVGCAIIGYSGFGKTTLAANAVRAGWGYVSDELGLVDEHHVAHAFHRPLGLRHGGMFHLGLERPTDPLLSVVNPRRASTLGVLAPNTRLRSLVFLVPPSSDGAVQPMSPAAALATLLGNVHGASGVEHKVFRRLERLVRAVPAVQLPRSHPDAMVASLDRLLEDAAVAPER